MKTINLSAFNEASSLTIIATYAYLRYRQSQGEKLTFDENCLLNGRLGDSPLYEKGNERLRFFKVKPY